MGLASEEVKSRVNIVELIGEYVKLNKAGLNWKANCPFHREKTPSFMVNDERQMWHCFGCGKGGDAFAFVMEMEGLDFRGALKLLAEKSGVDLSRYQKEYSSPEKEDDKKKTLAILDLSARFYEVQLWQGAGKDKILGYLKDRGLTDGTIKEFRLGYAPPGWRNLLEFLTKRGYQRRDIAASGLLVQKEGTDDFYDRFRDRIVFPIQDSFGKVVGFTARVAPGGDEKQAKYVNTPETAVYHKSQVLYGLDKARQAIKEKGFALVVEGNMDVIASHQAGLRNTVAVSGTALTAEQLAMLKRYAENIKLLFDMDEAGEASIRRSAELAFQKELNVSVVRLPEGKDAAELANKDPQKLIAAAEQSVPAMEYLIRQIMERHPEKDPAAKKKIAQEAVPIIAHFGNEIEKMHWVKALAHRLEVEERVILDVLRKERRSDHPSAGAPAGDDRSGNEPHSREEIIQGEIVGLALADRESWERISQDPEMLALFPEGSLFRKVLESGPAANFRMEQAVALLEESAERRRVEDRYFRANFRMVPGSGVEEIDPGDIWERVEKSFQELRKEYNRKRLKNILQDIRRAEEQGDKESLAILIQEFTRLSQEVR